MHFGWREGMPSLSLMLTVITDNFALLILGMASPFDPPCSLRLREPPRRLCSCRTDRIAPLPET
jgi:hypothetical protein